MIPERIQGSTTPAGLRRQRQRESQPLQDSGLRSGQLRATVNVQFAPGLLWDSIGARDAGSKSEKKKKKTTSRTRSCPQRHRHRAANFILFAWGGRGFPQARKACPSTSAARVGTWKPCARRDCAANSASRMLGGTPGPAAFCRGRSKSASVPRCFPAEQSLVEDTPSPPMHAQRQLRTTCRDGREMSRFVTPRQQGCQTPRNRCVVRCGEHIRGAGRHSAQGYMDPCAPQRRSMSLARLIFFLRDDSPASVRHRPSLQPADAAGTTGEKSQGS